MTMQRCWPAATWSTAARGSASRSQAALRCLQTSERRVPIWVQPCVARPLSAGWCFLAKRMPVCARVTLPARLQLTSPLLRAREDLSSP